MDDKSSAKIFAFSPKPRQGSDQLPASPPEPKAAWFRKPGQRSIQAQARYLNVTIADGDYLIYVPASEAESGDIVVVMGLDNVARYLRHQSKSYLVHDFSVTKQDLQGNPEDHIEKYYTEVKGLEILVIYVGFTAH